VEEMKHAEMIAERLFYLGGRPTTKPDPIFVGENLEEMLEQDKKDEEVAVKLYRQIIELAEKEKDVADITAEQGRIRGLVSVLSFSNVYYVVRRLRDRRAATRAMLLLRGAFTPVACDEQVLSQAIDAGMNDGDTNTIPRQSASEQPVARCSLRTAAMPIVTSSSSEMARDSMPVWWENFRGIAGPNQALSSCHDGWWTAIAEMPRAAGFMRVGRAGAVPEAGRSKRTGILASALWRSQRDITGSIPSCFDDPNPADPWLPSTLASKAGACRRGFFQGRNAFAGPHRPVAAGRGLGKGSWLEKTLPAFRYPP